MISDKRIQDYTRYIKQLIQGHYDPSLPITPLDDMDDLGKSLQQLASTIKLRIQETQKLDEVAVRINSAVQIEEILQSIFNDFQKIIPYHRIGFSRVDDEKRSITAEWANSLSVTISIDSGYTLPLDETSLEPVLRSRQPRIINDLEEYFKEHPNSESTRLILEEGIRSSLTCPLHTDKTVCGVSSWLLFFSSCDKHTYANTHVEIFLRIARLLSGMVQKSHLVKTLLEKQQLLNKKNTQLQELNDLKNTFLGMAAHDLRGPIVQVLWTNEIISDPDIDMDACEQKELSELTNQSCEHMLDLIDDLLDVTRIESGKLVLEIKEIQLDDLVQNTVLAHGVHARRKNISFDLQKVSAVIHADPNRVKQILDNLISNAVKYSPPQSCITVGIEPCDLGWRVNVKDQGPGLSEEDQQELFQEFKRLSSKPTGNEKSSGLGLAIAKKIVTAHGGTIGAESNLGDGSTFWFELPNQK